MRALTYAIGDIHGRLDLLEQLLTKIEHHAAQGGASAKIVFTGDFVDRGADSFGVVQRLVDGPRRPGDRFVPLRGNHDALFASAATHGRDVPEWAWHLFRHTVRSYGIGVDRPWQGHADLTRHADFLSSLPLFHEDGEHLFVHAGIRPGIGLAEQAEHDLLWIRDEFLHHGSALPWRVVHGHTIMGDQPEVHRHRISIDTGAYSSGILTAAVLDGSEVTFLQAIGAPDRSAHVREVLLAAGLAGRVLPTALQRACDAYVEGAFEAAELRRHLLPLL